jgi:multiple sugar transport system substrate-binding protein
LNWRIIKEETGKPAIYVQILDDNWTTQAMMESNGGSMIACDNGIVRATFDAPENTEALQFWADMIEEGLALNVLSTQGEQAFLAGEVATYMTTIAKRNNLEANASFDLRGTTFPAFTGKETRLPGGGNTLVVFSQDQEKQEAAFRFIEFLQSAESFATWTRGTGYVPLNRDTPEVLGDFLTENPIQEVAIRQMPNVVTWITFPGADGLAAQQSLFAASQQAFLGQMSAEAALQASAAEVNSLLANESCE